MKSGAFRGWKFSHSRRIVDADQWCRRDEDVEVEATWGVYQQLITACREPDKAKGTTLMQALITARARGDP